MGLKAIQFIALFLLMLVTGVFWGTWFSLSRSMEVFSAEEFIHIGKTIIQNLAWPMRIIMPASLLFMLVSLWIYPAKKSIRFYFGLASFALIIAALLITLIVEVPIDNQIRQWAAATIPADWQAIRDRWETFHALRTYCSLGSFGCYVLAIMN